ncbi:hypothetical protein Pmar_PMAR023372 [Perkinsus marinus ATCC 50983]|uniref:Uncharacterized protein n=1 Tax=Perkinsus marinus (strain ATCC 50983 / TXsc) TaxID=423536 RepID=C5KKD5_PERM5|nr:hypothetical protein Pmar_PMAR023372 [Perkinsus marinus ATCC 50983]EER15047.1 hypothetical protein Pmar_PMAR023372 [Perkinsus marinus ATCC 50983]|eukprot:XP_002783251.1 hypothetical protein Pmar_PMAR023372 [Perkinsus marinus ATCC 50983]
MGERLLPLTADEVSSAKDGLQQIRTRGVVVASESAVQPMSFYGQQTTGAAGLQTVLPSSTPSAPIDEMLDRLEREVSNLTGSNVAADIESIMVALGNLSPEQIASLPEMIIGPVFSNFAVKFNWPSINAFARTSIIGRWLGSGFGCLAHFIVQEMGGGIYYRLWAVLFFLPITFFFCMSQSNGGCKMSEIIMGQTSLVSSGVAVLWFVNNGYKEGTAFAVFQTFGTLTSFIILQLLHLAHLLPADSPPPFQRFSYSAANLYDILTSYIVSGDEHTELLRSAYDDFLRACVSIASHPVTADVNTPAWEMVADLFSLRQNLKSGKFSDLILENYWQPMAADLLELRSSVGLVLRSIYETEPTLRERADAINLRDRARVFEAHLLKVNRSAASLVTSGDIEPPDDNEFMRFQSALGSAFYFACRAQDYRDASLQLRAKNSEQAERYSCHPFAGFVAWWKAWWAEPFFRGLNEGGGARPTLIYAARFTLAVVIGEVVLVVGQHYSEGVRQHGLWGILPVYLCFLPTCGASLLRGGRRTIGTLAGAAVSVICLSANPHDSAAIFVEMMIVVFIGKSASSYGGIGYAGTVFILTWFVVCMGLAIGTTLPPDQMMIAAAWRAGLTAAGGIYVTIFSAVFFPEFAAVHYKQAAAHTVKECSNGVEEAVWQLVRARSELRDAPLHDPRDDFSHAVFKSLSTQVKYREDASAEIAMLGSLKLLSPTTKRVLRRRAEIGKLVNEALVLHNALIASSLSVTGPAAKMLDCILPSLRDFGLSLQSSSERLFIAINEEKNIPPFKDDVNVAAQMCLDTFLNAKNRLVEDCLAGSEGAAGIISSGGFRIYYLVYAVTVFAGMWTGVENRLIGQQPPVEMATESLDSSDTSLSTADSTDDVPGLGVHEARRQRVFLDVSQGVAREIPSTPAIAVH